jgi:S1-C subfamily serine protease
VNRATTPVFAALLLMACLGAEEAPQPERGSLEEELILKQTETVQDQLIRTLEAVRPSSVSVLNYVKRGDAFTVAGSGSGVVIRAKGLVLTNQHVVQNADRLELVFLDGRRLEATVENRVLEYDLALLQARDPKGKPVGGLKPSAFGRSGPLQAGRWVVATGNPFFLASSGRSVATLGIVSGLNRIAGGEFLYGNAIQHDAEINPGNSGGPLWDLDGRLLGINGKISSRALGAQASTGVGYTIPIDQVQNFLKGLLDEESDRVEPGDLGVTVETAKDGKGRETGAKVTAVRAGSPAAKAKGGGIRPGDVIEEIALKFKTHRIRNATEFTNVLAMWPEGTQVDSLRVRREGKTLTFQSLVLGPPAPKEGKTP